MSLSIALIKYSNMQDSKLGSFFRILEYTKFQFNVYHVHAIFAMHYYYNLIYEPIWVLGLVFIVYYQCLLLCFIFVIKKKNYYVLTKIHYCSQGFKQQNNYFPLLICMIKVHLLIMFQGLLKKN